MGLRKSLFLLATLLVLGGCAATKKNQLSDRLDFYRRALQMQDEALLSSMVMPSKAESFQKEIGVLNRLHVSHAEVRAVNANDDASEAQVTYFIEFFSQDGSLLQSGNFLMSWKYDKGAMTWLLDEPHPFGKQILRK